MSVDTDPSRIRRILLSHWDPLSVGDNPKLADEYEQYLPQIVDMIIGGCTAEELAEHLKWLEWANMGMELPREVRERAVTALLEESGIEPESIR